MSNILGLDVHKKENIPTRNQIFVIEDFDDNYNYVLEGNQLYRNKKNNQNYINISNDEETFNRILQHINNTSGWGNYVDGEEDLYKSKFKQQVPEVAAPQQTFSIVEEPQQPIQPDTQKVETPKVQILQTPPKLKQEVIAAQQPEQEKGSNTSKLERILNTAKQITLNLADKVGASYQRALPGKIQTDSNKVGEPEQEKEFSIEDYYNNNPMQFASDSIPTSMYRTEQDSSYKAGKSLTNEQLGFVFHHTGLYPGQTAEVIAKNWKHRPKDSKDQRSAHVIIDTDGSRYILAEPESVTFHSGKSHFNGRDGVNDFMIGIEFYGDTSKQHLTPEQIKSAVEYMTPIIIKNKMNRSNMTTHKIVRDNWIQQHPEDWRYSKPDLNDVDYDNIMQALDEVFNNETWWNE